MIYWHNAATWTSAIIGQLIVHCRFCRFIAFACRLQRFDKPYTIGIAAAVYADLSSNPFNLGPLRGSWLQSRTSLVRLLNISSHPREIIATHSCENQEDIEQDNRQYRIDLVPPLCLPEYVRVGDKQIGADGRHFCYSFFAIPGLRTTVCLFA